MRTKPLKWIVPTLLVLFLAPAALAIVSVDEIVRLHTAGLNQDALLLVVTASATPDTLTTADLSLLIDANVPDTVITALVAKADAVMEDWEPVNVDEELGGRTIYTEAEVNVYPQWYAGLGGYSYWDPWYYPAPYYAPYYPYYRPYGGWCGTWGWPYYGSGLYVGIGGCGWSIGIGWGGGYCGYWGGGYCGWGGGYCGGGYYPSYPAYPGTGYARYIDRPNYRQGVQRDVVRSDGGKTYRTQPTRDVGQLTGVDYQRSTVKDATRGSGRHEIRGDLDDSQPTRTGRDLTRAQLDDKSTIKNATVGKGRYELKGDAKTPEVKGTKTGRNVSTGSYAAEGGSKSTRYQKSNDRELRADITKSTARNTDARAVERTKAETKQQQLNRYKNMKSTSRTVNAKSGGTVGSSRKATSGSRSTRSTAAYKSPARSTSPETTGTNRTKTTTPKVESGSKTRSTAEASGKSSGTRTKSSAPQVRTSSPRSSGGSAGVSRGGARSGGGGGSRGGGR